MKATSSISITTTISILFLLVLQSCAAGGTRGEYAAAVEQARIDELSVAILALGADIDPKEARRAARVAISYSRQLAAEFDMGESPLWHNVMVNLGFRERGLCVHWTRDLMIRLQQERFRSLELHWGVANYDSVFRIEHNTVIVSARDAGMQQGLVLDGWRHSGELYWAPVLDDPEYRWRPHAEIQALKERRAEQREDWRGQR